MPNKFKPQIFICPADPESNHSIVKHPSLMHIEPSINEKCYFGSNLVVLSTFPVGNMMFSMLKNSKSVSFYAFIQKEKEGKKHYFYSQGIKKTDDKLNTKMAELVKKLERMKKNKDVVSG